MTKNTRTTYRLNLHLIVFILTLTVGFLATGCGSTKVTTNTQASVGQQLADLEKSYKEGIITQKEYEKLKRRIVKDND